jgi:hypothetical protein
LVFKLSDQSTRGKPRGIPVQNLERGKVKGHINWSKDPATNEIYATVNLKILTCAYADPENDDKPQQFLCIGSDGMSLVSIEDVEDLETILRRCDDERLGITQNNVVPICTMDAKFKLELNPDTGEHYLKADEFLTQFNTPDLISSKDISANKGYSPSR